MTANLNGRFGSILVVQVGLQAICWKTGYGYLQTKTTTLQNVGYDPECGNWSAENSAGLREPTYDDCLSPRNRRARPPGEMSPVDPFETIVSQVLIQCRC